MASVVEHKRFSLTELGANHNKFWNVTLFDNGDVKSEWGRQGDPPQTKTWAGAGRSHMEKKIREKEAKGYRENLVAEAKEAKPAVRVDSYQLKTIAASQIKTTSKVVQDLIDFLVQVNAHQIAGLTQGKITYDTTSAMFKTTQGVVVPAQVAHARQLLNTMAQSIALNDWDIDNELNEYLSLIPAILGGGVCLLVIFFLTLEKFSKRMIC